MIIRLSGADFSANNIGTIQLIKEVTQETRDLLANYSREFTKTQKLAVQDFIDGLKSEGIWSHIENLYIPALAGDLSESLFDVKGGVVDANPSADYYLIESNGLRTNFYSSSTVIPTNSRAIINVNGSYMNQHYMAYIADNVWGDENHYSYEAFLTSYNNSAYRGLNIAENTNNNQWLLSITGNPERAVQSVSNSKIGTTIKGFICISSGSDGTPIGIIDNHVDDQLSPTETTDTTMTDVPTFIGCSVQGYAKCSTPMRIISTGTAMDMTMMQKYNELCDALIGKIC